MLTPIATVEERLRIINECRQSGLTANEWCRRHGLRWNTYHTWVTRLKKKGLLETAATVPAVMEIELGQIRIRASNQANPMLLAEVIRQIGGIQGC